MKVVINFLFIFWCTTNYMLVLCGLFFSKSVYPSSIGFEHDGCKEPPRRYEKLFPGYQIGCFLGQPSHDK